MKKLSWILCLILVISMLPSPAYAESDGSYYDQLSSEAFQQAYALLEEGIASMAPVIHFPTDLEIWYLDMLEVARAVCLDHPEYFWFLESWFTNTTPGMAAIWWTSSARPITWIISRFPPAVRPWRTR